MNTTTVTAEFDPQANHGRGAAGYLATTAAGISRWATTAAKAIQVAEKQEAIYRAAGELDAVLEQLYGRPVEEVAA